jgi:hypothetical protein
MPVSLDAQEKGQLPWIAQVFPWLRGMGSWGDRELGRRRPTPIDNVWIREVSLSTRTRMIVNIGRIHVEHRAIPAWGRTTANAVVDFARPTTPDGRYRLRLVGTTLDLDITLRPPSQFNTIAEFAPFYRELAEDFGGDQVRFCRAKGMRLDPAYNAFGTIEGVLYHELVHGVVATRSARSRWRRLVRSFSGGPGYESAEGAVADLLGQIPDVWAGFHGALVHGDAMLDEVFVWEKECAWYVKAYEQHLALAARQ